ncbi:MAG: TolC family protein [Gammaproteobacteria bacterium]|nr:TolC family protein [Gammaproteobacteria bacterium]
MSWHRSWTGFLLAGVVAAATASAHEPIDYAPPADLPPLEVVNALLDHHPAVLEAEARLRMAMAERDALRAGSHEAELRLSGQRRDITGDPRDSREWGASIERGFRLFGKAGLDRQIGARGVGEARENVGDARHETGRQLLGLWYGALRAMAENNLRAEQTALLEQVRETVDKRTRRGDAARLELLQADASLAQARSGQQQALGRQQAAVSALRASFPDLPVAMPRTIEPVLPPGGQDEWVTATLAHNHELLAVQNALEASRLAARRASRDRLPDPTLGIYYQNEQHRDEEVVGVSVAVPIGLGARRAEVRRQFSQAEAFAALELATRQRLAAEALVNWEHAASGTETWRQLQLAAQATTRHAELARRAWELGELPLAEALLARSQAFDAEVAAELARLDANEAISRLLLDAHHLWATEDDDEPHGG